MNRTGRPNHGSRQGAHSRDGKGRSNNGGRGAFGNRSGGGGPGGAPNGGGLAGGRGPTQFAGGGGVVNNPATGGFGGFGAGGLTGAPGGGFGGFDASYGGGVDGGGGGGGDFGQAPATPSPSVGDKLGAASRSPGDPAAGGTNRDNPAFVGGPNPPVDSPSQVDPGAAGDNRNAPAFFGGDNPAVDPIAAGSSRVGGPTGGFDGGFYSAQKDADLDDGPGADEPPVGRYFDRRFLVLENRTGLPLKIWLRYRTHDTQGPWRWYSGGGKQLVYVLSPGEQRYVGHRGTRILAERITIWARDESGKLYDTYRFRELVLGRSNERDRNGNLAYSGTHFGTFTYRFR